jgi:tetratricopeptide (TPR) repeat protein
MCADASISQLTRALELNPKNGDVYSSRALVYLAAGRNTEAMQDLEQCIALDPSDPKTFVRVGAFHRGNHEMLKAISVMEQACSLFPLNAQMASRLERWKMEQLAEYSDACQDATATGVRREEEHSKHAEAKQQHRPSASTLSPSADEGHLSHDNHHRLSCARWSQQGSERSTEGDARLPVQASQFLWQASYTESKDFRWHRSTSTGKWFSPCTSTVNALEARQRKIRHKCVEVSKRRQDSLVKKRQSILDAQADRC